MKIVAISDVHGKWKNLQIPECDVLVSAGDYSFTGEPHMIKEFHKWLNKQPAKHIISVQGNHETFVEKNFNEAKQMALDMCPRVHFIDEGIINIEGYNIYGSAITPEFHNWAWNRSRGVEIKTHWDKIPDNTEILITHGPPYDILDSVPSFGMLKYCGCEDLSKRIAQLSRLKLHIFGHIHYSYGEMFKNGVHYVNASICNEMYRPANKPIIIDF